LQALGRWLSYHPMLISQLVLDESLCAAPGDRASNRFQKEAQSGDDPDIKSFAAKSLPILRQHASLIKEAQGRSNSLALPTAP